MQALHWPEGGNSVVSLCTTLWSSPIEVLLL